MRSQPRLCVRGGEIPGHWASGPGSSIPRLRPSTSLGTGPGQARSGHYIPFITKKLAEQRAVVGVSSNCVACQGPRHSGHGPWHWAAGPWGTPAQTLSNNLSCICQFLIS
jgi:hypothetical protein